MNAKIRKEKTRGKESEIIRRYLKDDTVIQIAKDMGLSRERVYQYLRKLPEWKKARLDKRRRARKSSLERYRSICKDYRAGMTLEELGKKYGKSPDTIKMNLKTYLNEKDDL